jgi:hypothetical protein
VEFPCRIYSPGEKSPKNRHVIRSLPKNSILLIFKGRHLSGWRKPGKNELSEKKRVLATDIRCSSGFKSGFNGKNPFFAIFRRFPDGEV